MIDSILADISPKNGATKAFIQKYSLQKNTFPIYLFWEREVPIFNPGIYKRLISTQPISTHCHVTHQNQAGSILVSLTTCGGNQYAFDSVPKKGKCMWLFCYGWFTTREIIAQRLQAGGPSGEGEPSMTDTLATTSRREV